MSTKNVNKKFVMHVLPNGTCKYIVVEDTDNSSEKKQTERRIINADAMAKALFGDN